MMAPRDRDLLFTILNIAVTFAVMLLAVRFIGELHGLFVIVISLIVQTSFLSRRVVTLERELRSSRESSESEHRKIAEKAV